jgi:hypothetical protein
MRFCSFAIFASATLFSCSLASALEINARTDLMANCGAAYMLAANDKTAAPTQDQAEDLRTLATQLLNQVDEALAAQGMSLSAREKFGENRILEVSKGLQAESAMGFTPDDCTALTAELAAEGKAAEPAAAELTAQADYFKDLDKLLTCMSGFYFASQHSEEAKEAESLMKVSNTLSSRAEDVLVEAGWNLKAREQVGTLYGLQVNELLGAGNEMKYSWEECSELAF